MLFCLRLVTRGRRQDVDPGIDANWADLPRRIRLDNADAERLLQVARIFDL
jgi:hypothetical protein